jgi:hypothetical protein
MGTLWHHVLATWYRCKCTATIAQIKTDVIDPWLEARYEWASGNLEHGANMVLDEDNEHAQMVAGMFDHYVQTYPNDGRDWDVIAVEPQVARWIDPPINDDVTINGKQVPRRWAYGGALDLLVRLGDGSHWMVEHKTTAERDLSHYMRKLDWDPQIRGYAWMLANPIADVSDIKDPVRISGVIYNVARKKVPDEPEPLKRGGLSKSKGIDTTRALYLGAIMRHGLNPDDYGDVLEQLQSKTFFAREHYVFTDPELDDFSVDIAHVALEMRQASVPGTYLTRQQRICTGPGAIPCPYAQICLTDGPQMRRAFGVRGIRHAELTGDLAEPYAAQERGLTLSGKIVDHFSLQSTSSGDNEIDQFAL